MNTIIFSNRKDLNMISFEYYNCSYNDIIETHKINKNSVVYYKDFCKDGFTLNMIGNIEKILMKNSNAEWDYKLLNKDNLYKIYYDKEQNIEIFFPQIIEHIEKIIEEWI